MNWKDRLTALKEQDASVVATEAFPDFHQQLTRYAATDIQELEDDDRKSLIIETRAALRFGNACLAAEESRQTVQQVAVVDYSLYEPLCRILTLSTKGDAKCRLLAARLFSNLLTGNLVTARHIMEAVALSPSELEVSNSIRNVVSSNDDDEESTTDDDAAKLPLNQMNWVDIMLGCARTGSRDALGATVAALHNSVSILGAAEDGEAHTTRVATDQLLVSTLLRLMLPSASTLDKNNQKSAADAATEWISLLLEHLCRLGLLPQMYASVGSTMVTPEHIVLLHCAAMAVDDWLESSSLLEKPHPLASTGDGLATSHLFLADQVSIIRSTLQGKVVSDDAGDDSELALAKAALLIILEILAASLGNDRSQYLDLARTKLGNDSSILSDVSHDLGTMVDVLLKANHGMKARDMTMTETEQRWITTLVRLLGNVCYRCRSNQDALRLLQIPLEGATEVRTALHVLLSCTSLAPGCFTLREWAIVALRNVLEGNEENQALVEKLEAQQPMQSTELERMGLRVDMDRHGKVKIVQEPEKKKEEEASSTVESTP